MLRQLYAHKLLAADIRYSIVLGQGAVDEGEIGIEQIENAAVLAHHRREEHLRLAAHRVAKIRVEIWKELGIRG